MPAKSLELVMVFFAAMAKLPKIVSIPAPLVRNP
jgi:hypothetical protein